jgi:hypothetical protein
MLGTVSTVLVPGTVGLYEYCSPLVVTVTRAFASPRIRYWYYKTRSTSTVVRVLYKSAKVE